MAIEMCVECGFDGAKWTDEEALTALESFPERWRQAASGVDARAVGSRPIDGMWSIAECTDHVRGTTFGQRFILDVALADPGTDLGPAPKPIFAAQAAQIDIVVAFLAFETELAQLSGQLRACPPNSGRTQ
jgi:hypothetical protein